jgi:flagellar assembly protein FliH
MSLDAKPPRQVPPPSGGSASAKSTAYARFIPREELSSFSAWSPASLSEHGAAEAAREAPVVSAPAAAQAARQSGYQEGYRDGLAALEGFKQSYAQQMSAQLGQLLRGFDQQIETLEEQMAQALAHAAMDLAGQVVRHELCVQPELVGSVAREAVASLLLSARHVSVRVHPDDQALVLAGAGDELQRRGAQLVADAAVSRGGCMVESDVGLIDARIENLWRRAAAALGGDADWSEDAQ